MPSLRATRTTRSARPSSDPAQTIWDAVMQLHTHVTRPVGGRTLYSRALTGRFRLDPDIIRDQFLVASLQDWSEQHPNIPIHRYDAERLIGTIHKSFRSDWFDRQIIHETLDHAYLPHAKTHALNGFLDDIRHMTARRPVQVFGRELRFACMPIKSRARDGWYLPAEAGTRAASLIRWLRCLLQQDNPLDPRPDPLYRPLFHDNYMVFGYQWVFDDLCELYFSRTRWMRAVFASAEMARYAAFLINTAPDPTRIVWSFPARAASFFRQKQGLPSTFR